MPRRAYICLITLELASIAIKYQGPSTNPFQEIHASMLLFLIAIFCHAVALATQISMPTAILFHVSGAIACESLLWILVAEFWWCIIINGLLLLVVGLCFYYKHIFEAISNLLGTCFRWILVVKPSDPVVQEGPHADQTERLEAQEKI